MRGEVYLSKRMKERKYIGIVRNEWKDKREISINQIPSQMQGEIFIKGGEKE